jgi:hypothetical protein
MQEGSDGIAVVFGMTVMTWVNAFKPAVTAEYVLSFRMLFVLLYSLF